MSAVVIIPTTGAPALRRAVRSVLAQTTPAACYVVCDGERYRESVAAALAGLDVTLCVLPRNVGADGFYGHRIYAAFAHLVDEEHVLFLDQDNFFAPDHVSQCVDLIAARRLQWAYALRNVCDADGAFVCRDDCESLGKWPAFTKAHLIDTSSYCVRRDVLLQAAHAWHGKWGQDRVFAQVMMGNFAAFDCTGRYTVQYCLGGNAGSVTRDFFEQGNAQMLQRYKRGFPWARD
jgi:glycosyltransferase involved in cell wall biosynthesis